MMIGIAQSLEHHCRFFCTGTNHWTGHMDNSTKRQFVMGVSLRVGLGQRAG